jgi:hypothetical protein
LWVSFELGRPLGAPGDADFQTRVLLAALKLLEADGGPLLEDFPEDAPPSDSPTSTLSCPVSFAGKERELDDLEKLTAAFKEEIAGLRNWYELALQKRGRTTFGVSGLEIDRIVDFISAFLAGRTPDNPRKDIALGYTINLAVDDLKAYYYEAATAQPGQESPSSEVLNEWFWTETAVSKALYKLRDICTNSEDGLLNLVGKMLLVPVEFAFR